MKKVLITGISGFAGSFLAEQLILGNKTKVYGVYLNDASLINLRDVEDKIHFVRLDLSNQNEVLKLINEISPDYVYHLAALTSPSHSFDLPFETIENNVRAELNIFEAVRKLKILETRILITSSAEVYGLVGNEDLPIDEETPFMPTNPYSVSKLTQDFLGLQYALSFKMQVVRVRPFNHIGPRQTDRFVIGAFAKKIAEIEKGKRNAVLSVGNLESKRDFTDVRDMVKAYVLAIEKGKEGDVYNLGSGRSYAISELLDKLLALSKVKIEVREDEALLRPSDNPNLICDSSKFYKLTGWKPEISIDKTLKDTLDYWRNII